jgi:hypothetical protein
MRKRKQLGSLSEICEVVEAGTMPLKSYSIMHRDAKLTDAEKTLLCAWSDSLASEILAAEAP